MDDRANDGRGARMAGIGFGRWVKRNRLIIERNLFFQGRFASSLLIWKRLVSRNAEEGAAIATLFKQKLRNQLRFQGNQATTQRSIKSVP